MEHHYTDVDGDVYYRSFMLLLNQNSVTNKSNSIYMYTENVIFRRTPTLTRVDSPRLLRVERKSECMYA